MKSVYSSHVNTIGHDGTDLFVTWDSGKTSVYKGVPAKLASEVTSSWSVGKALAEQVKGKYDHEYLSGS